jgi:branched-chain amino acid transport system permease protein
MGRSTKSKDAAGADDSAETTSVLTAEVEPDPESTTGSLAGRLGVARAPGRLSEFAQGIVENPKRGVGLVVTAAAVAVLFTADINIGRVLVDGLQAGSVYALIALGLALVYSSTRVLNFAQGEFGTVPAFFVLTVLLGGDLSRTVDPSAVGVLQLAGLTLVAILIGAILAVGVNLLIIQRLADSSPVTSLVATAGVTLLLTGAQFVAFQPMARRFPRFLDGAPCLEAAGGECTRFLTIFGSRVSWHAMVIAVVLAIVAVLLAALFRTPIGVALLASAQDPFAASLHGVSPKAMSSLAWACAGGLGALSGVLGAGVFERLTPGLMTTTFLIPGFTAAVLGGITSMVGAVVGGLLLGVTASLASTVVVNYGLDAIIPGPTDFAAFVVLLLVLLLRPGGLLGKEA